MTSKISGEKGEVDLDSGLKDDESIGFSKEIAW